METKEKDREEKNGSLVIQETMWLNEGYPPLDLMVNLQIHFNFMANLSEYASQICEILAIFPFLKYSSPVLPRYI